MAPVGHTVPQAPQPAHRYGLTLTRSPSLTIAFAEQMSTQALQAWMPLRPWAQMRSL